MFFDLSGSYFLFSYLFHYIFISQTVSLGNIAGIALAVWLCAIDLERTFALFDTRNESIYLNATV